MNTSKRKNKTRDLVLTALLFALAIVLSLVENTLPDPVPTVPGIKFGLSNIIVMYALFFSGKDRALTLALLKGLFALASRGPMAGVFSTLGGLTALGAMVVVILLLKDRASYLGISIIGAVFHNLGQFLAVILFYGTAMWTLLPILILSGLVAGFVTAGTLRLILPALRNIQKEDYKSNDAS